MSSAPAQPPPDDHGPDPDAPERQRAAIAAALVELSTERGYANLALPDLLGAAGIDEVVFERHFADLEDCFCLAFEERRKRSVQQILAGCIDKETWREQVRGAAHALLEFLQEDHRRARFLCVEVLSAGSRAQLVRDQGMEAFVELIDLGRNELDDPGSVSRATAEGIVGAFYLQIQRAVERDEFERGPELCAQLMSTAVLPYLGSEVAAEELELIPGVEQDLADADSS